MALEPLPFGFAMFSATMRSWSLVGKTRKMGDEQGAFMNDRVLDVVVAWGHLGVS